MFSRVFMGQALDHVEYIMSLFQEPVDRASNLCVHRWIDKDPVLWELYIIPKQTEKK